MNPSLSSIIYNGPNTEHGLFCISSKLLIQTSMFGVTHVVFDNSTMRQRIITIMIIIINISSISRGVLLGKSKSARN